MSDWTHEDHLEWWGERAAILEFDAGLPRKEAERRAYWDWRKTFPNVPAPVEMRKWSGAEVKRAELVGSAEQ